MARPATGAGAGGLPMFVYIEIATALHRHLFINHAGAERRGGAGAGAASWGSAYLTRSPPVTTRTPPARRGVPCPARPLHFPSPANVRPHRITLNKEGGGKINTRPFWRSFFPFLRSFPVIFNLVRLAADHPTYGGGASAARSSSHPSHIPAPTTT